MKYIRNMNLNKNDPNYMQEAAKPEVKAKAGVEEQLEEYKGVSAQQIECNLVRLR